jgi:CubicO group peptidase (beta-lactamase class C family)
VLDWEWARGEDDGVRSTLRVALALGTALGTAVLVVVGCTSGGSEAESPGPTPTPTSASAPSAPTATGPDGTARFPAPATQALPAADAAKLQAVLDEVVSRFRTVPDAETAARGVSAAAMSDGWSWTGAAGVDGIGRKLQPRSTMLVASITKTFVAAEVLRLAGQGRIDLDKPLATYVKHRLTANQATVRQFLAMRSGLPDYLPADYAALAKAFRAAPSQHWTAAQALAPYSATVGPPGVYEYSNPGYVLLGLLVEKVTRQPLATVLRRDLIAPAGLARVAVQDGERPPAPIANARTLICPGAPDGYLPCRAVASASAADGGMAADAASVARWGYQLYGGRVVPAGIVAAMTGGEAEYGLGTMRFSQSLGLGDAFGHRGGAPGYSTILVVVPERRVSVALLIADGPKRVDPVVSKLLSAIQQFR